MGGKWKPKIIRDRTKFVDKLKRENLQNEEKPSPLFRKKPTHQKEK